MENLKFETAEPFDPELKTQGFITDQPFWSLEIGYCDLFVFWCLGFGILFISV